MVLGSRYRPAGDFLGIGKALSKFGGFIPGVGGIVSKVGSVIQGIGAPKKPSFPTAPITKPSFVLPGGAAIKVDSTKTRASGLISTPFGGGVGTVTNTTYFSSGRTRKKIRRINPLNPKALSRSIRRIDKFQDFAKSVGFSRPPARLKGIKAPKRRRRTSCR